MFMRVLISVDGPYAPAPISELVASYVAKRPLIRDVRRCFGWFQGQPRSGEATLDEVGPVLDLLQASRMTRIR